MSENSYELRCSIYGHSSDVRAVRSLPGGDGFISGSRDRTVRVWMSKENNFVEARKLSGATHYVTCVSFLSPNSEYPTGLILAGSQDSCIYVFTPESSDPIAKLTGHSGNVCSLASGNCGYFVSGSWDKTARVWLGQNCVTVMEGHKEAVWAVEMFKGQGTILTGSADNTIRLWLSGKTEKVFKGHELCVRGLAVISADEFLSCANDHMVRHWKTSGECIGVFSGHEHYVYSIALLNSKNCFATSSEDHTVRIWEQGVCVQVIKLPAESLWSVACLENGDIVVGGSDSVVRVFTRHKQLMASEEEKVQFEAEVKEKLAPKSDQKVGDLNLDELREKEVLLNPGTHNGQTLLVREGDAACAYEWNEPLKEWIKLGDIIDAKDTKKKKEIFEGKEYDYLFNVEIEEGSHLKLPYNIGEDPWEAAQKFIYRNGLSQEFLMQVANFITANVPNSDKPQPSTSYVDPFTGASRYVPNGNVKSNASNSSGDSNLSETHYFPLKTYLLFEHSNAEGLRNKLTEFSESVEPRLKLTQNEIQQLLSLMNFPGSVSGEQMASLDKVMSWPESLVFPALDLFRMALRSPVIGQKIHEVGSSVIINYLMKFLRSGCSPVNVMLVVRAFCNLFSHPSGESLLRENIEKICVAAINCIPMNDKRIEVAVASLFLNYSVALHLSKLSFNPVITDGVISLSSALKDSEAIYRLLVCVGTLMDNSEASMILKNDLKSFVIDMACQDSADQKVALCAKELLLKFV